MKRALLLTTALMILVSTATALAAPGDAVLGRGPDYTFSVCYDGSFVIGDTLYLVNSETISTWRPGEAEATAFTIQVPSEKEKNDVSWSFHPFVANDRIYALAFATGYGERIAFQRAVLYEVSLITENNNNVAKLAERTELNWEGMLSRYAQDISANEPQSCVGMGNMCCMLIYDDATRLQLVLLNVDTGEIVTAKGLSDVYAVTPYKDGKLLVEQFSYIDARNVCFSVYDLQEGNSRQIAKINVDDSSPLPGLAYDAASDILYCVKGGEVHSIDLEKGEVGPAIADAPADYISNNAGCILKGGYYCHASSGAFIRNLNPEQRKETRIRVCDDSYDDSVNKAAATLSEAHSEVSAAINRDYAVWARLDESLLSRDGSIDIYIVNCSDKAFKAILSRGDMAGLADSEKLSALAERMYPDLRSALSRNGHLVAIPVSCSATCFAVNEKALERLGYELKDVPRNWPDMLDFISRLSERVKPADKISLFYENQTIEDAKQALLNQILHDYQNYAADAAPSATWHNDRLRGIIQKLEAIDFAGFGCRQESTDASADYVEPEGDSIEKDGAMPLFETLSDCSVNAYHTYTPILMAMDENTPACLALNMNVAFVNPYSIHPKEALLFMEQLADSLSNDTLYAIDPSLDTPVRNANYAEIMRDLENSLKVAEDAYEKASAAEKAQALEETRTLKQEIEDYEQMSWDISQTNLDWYRANDDHIVLQGVDLLNDGETGTVSTLVEQYVKGIISADAMLEGIDGEANAEQTTGS